MVQLLLNIRPEGVDIIRCDGIVQLDEPPFEQVAANPKLDKLGEVVKATNLTDIKRAVTEALAEGTGREIPENW